jgi:hypothetical protein
VADVGTSSQLDLGLEAYVVRDDTKNNVVVCCGIELTADNSSRVQNVGK